MDTSCQDLIYRVVHSLAHFKDNIADEVVHAVNHRLGACTLRIFHDLLLPSCYLFTDYVSILLIFGVESLAYY